MDRQHIHEVAGHLVREAYLPAILSPPDKLRRVGKPTVNAVYLALQSFGGLFMLPPLPVYRLVQPPYLGVQAFVLLGKVIYLLLLPLDFRRADPRADTVEDGRSYLGGGVLQLLGSQLSFYRFQFRFGLFFGYPGFLGLLLLLGDNVVRPFQMLTSGLHFGPKEKNVKPEVAVKAVKLSEDFEADKLSVDFAREDMGELDFIYSNPAPVPVNTSKKVYLYEKSIGFYSNISYTAPDYKFDLTKANKVRMKVFVPSYNDYTTVADVAGDWIAVNQLQKQVAVKLQNSAAGGSAWETQTEIVKTNLTTDQWIELEFDFSEVKDRKDYDKIVIQFGAEGHAAPGIFFFDDFYFGE